MDINLRKFKLDREKGIIMTDDGEFFHKNDILIWLEECRRGINTLYEFNKDRDDDWGIKIRKTYEDQLEILDKLIDYIRKKF
jgi:hypothetical protein